MQKLILIFPFAALILPAFAVAEFADVDTTHPNFQAIDFLQTRKVVGGKVAGDQVFFNPLQEINRAEAAKMIVLAAGVSMEKIINPQFGDVRRNDWFFPFVAAAAEEKIIRGFDDGSFRPAQTVSRAEAVKMTLLAFGAEIESADSDQEWFQPFFEFADNLNILTQKSPDQNLTRAEMAEILYRTRKVQKNNFAEKYVFSGQGAASFYNEGFAGKATASGEIYDPNAMTAAHRTLPFGTRLRVRLGEKSVVVRINDRGPYHKKRVLDLSQKAFERLSPISRGVISVDFEVYRDSQIQTPAIPEFVRPAISEDAKTNQIPDAVAEAISYQNFPETSPKRTSQTPFLSSVSFLPADFFPNVELRRPIPKKILTGTVLNFSGTTNFDGAKTATVFLQSIKPDQTLGPQSHFSTQVSGRNFQLPVFFFTPGRHQIGLVFDNQRKSRVEFIEVGAAERVQNFDRASISFFSEFDFQMHPENSEVQIKWQTEKDRLSRLVFSQNKVQKTLLIEGGISDLRVPFSFFDEFGVDANLQIKLDQAASSDGSFTGQNSDWKSVNSAEFLPTFGFPDAEKTEKIAVFDFPRFRKNLTPLYLRGQFKSRRTTLSKEAFLTTPDGKVKSLQVEKNGESFSVSFAPQTFGTHIFELISEEGEILFNRAIYFSDSSTRVLPIKTWPQTSIRGPSRPSIRSWANRIRASVGSSQVYASGALDQIAQQYAEQMAEDNFISHTSPTGRTFEQRVAEVRQMGPLAENLTFGTSIEIAMAGLENSGSHRKNIIRRTFKKVGIGIAQNAKGHFFIVQVFGSK